MKLLLIYPCLFVQVDTARSISDANESISLFIVFLVLLLGFAAIYFFKRKRVQDALDIREGSQDVQAQIVGVHKEAIDKGLPKLKSTQQENTKSGSAHNSGLSVDLPGTESIARHQELIQPEKEEQSTVKIIGYEPINIFAQSEPLFYPIVVMPKRWMRNQISEERAIRSKRIQRGGI